MSDSLITRKEHSHNTPLHYGYRKDFNDLLNSLFNGWLELPSERRAQKYGTQNRGCGKRE